MKFSIESIPPGQETQVIIRCHETDEQVMQLLQFIQAGVKSVIGFENSNIVLIHPHDVFYFESVDNRVFIYLQDKVYESRQKLYEIEADFGSDRIFRASKSTILNIAKIRLVRPLLGGRFEAQLLNGEYVIISRQYVRELKSRLGL